MGWEGGKRKLWRWKKKWMKEKMRRMVMLKRMRKVIMMTRRGLLLVRTRLMVVMKKDDCGAKVNK